MGDIYNQIVATLSANEFFQGGMILGLLTWLGYQLKAIPTFLINKLRYYATYTIHFDDSSEFYRVFSEWLHDNHPKKFRNIEVSFSTDSTQNEPQIASYNQPNEQSDTKLRKRQFSDSNVIFYNNRWLWIQKERKEISGLKDIRSLFYNNYSISGLFAKDAIDNLCAEIVRIKNEEKEEKKIFLYSYDGYDWYSKPLSLVKTFDHIFFSHKQEYLDDIHQFIEQKDLYASKGINAKRSYLLYGRGGTGKTTTAVATAHKLGYDIYICNLANITEADLIRLHRRIPQKSLVLLEDVDCVVQNRDVDNKELSFSSLLNFLDGLYTPQDCILILTTNKPELLDEAMIRKGRVDLALCIDYPTRAEILAFVSDFYNCDVDLPVGFVLNKPMSDVQEICIHNSDIHNAVKELIELSLSKNGHEKFQTVK